MIRMTLLLLFGIGVTMALYGNDTGLPQGSDAGKVAVAPIDSTGPGILTQISTLIDNTTAPVETAERVPLQDEKRAIEIALAATRAPSGPAAPKSQTVQISGAGPTTAPTPTPEPTSAAVTQEGLWFVTGTTVNLRGGPSTSDAVVGQVRRGQQAEVIEETADGWFRIRTLDDGQDGYIFGRFLSQNRPG